MQYYYQFSQLLPPHVYHSLKKSWLSYVRLQLETKGNHPIYHPLADQGQKDPVFATRVQSHIPIGRLPLTKNRLTNYLFCCSIPVHLDRPWLSVGSFLQKDLVKPVKDNEIWCRNTDNDFILSSTQNLKGQPRNTSRRSYSSSCHDACSRHRWR